MSKEEPMMITIDAAKKKYKNQSLQKYIELVEEAGKKHGAWWANMMQARVNSIYAFERSTIHVHCEEGERIVNEMRETLKISLDMLQSMLRSSFNLTDEQIEAMLPDEDIFMRAMLEALMLAEVEQLALHEAVPATSKPN